jgi:hypothetical protein
MSFGPKYDSDIPAGHAMQETRRSRPNDILLRCHGFSIFSRHKNDEPIWERAGKQYSQGAALAMCAGVRK